MIRVFLAEDQAMVLDALAVLLELEGDIMIVAAPRMARRLCAWSPNASQTQLPVRGDQQIGRPQSHRGGTHRPRPGLAVGSAAGPASQKAR